MKAVHILLCILMVHFVLVGVETVENPVIPQNKDHGKTLQLKEVLQIRDMEGDGNFFFKKPGKLKIASDGGIFVKDKRQLLKFGADGKFIRNFYKHGRGPWEVSWIDNYLLDGHRLIIHDSGQNKILILNHQTGERLKEFRLRTVHIDKLFFYHGKNLYFLRKETVDTGGKLRIFDVALNLMRVSLDGEHIEKINQFPVKHLVIRSGSNFFIEARARLLSCPLGKELIYFSHTPEYDVKVYSFSENKVMRRFSRRYSRVGRTEENKKYAPGGTLGKISIEDGQWHKVPVAENLLDIQGLFCFKDKLWVVTSTVKGGNRVLVDVYDSNGTYVDNFFILCPEEVSPFKVNKWLYALYDDFFYAVEQDSTGQQFIKKYQIVKE